MPAPRSYLVTGASTGIGRACALHLDAAGHRVFAGVRKESDAKALRAEASDRFTPVMLDVTDAEAVAAAAQMIQDTVGNTGLHGLINNAGVVVAAPVEIVPITELRQQLEINTIGAIAVIQAMLPMLRAASTSGDASGGGGRIVNISSISGRIAFPLLGPYAASKFALGALSDALRVELYGTGITVTNLEPGSVRTPIWDKSVDYMARVVKDLPPEVVKPYEPLLTGAAANAKEKTNTGMPVEMVVERMMRALFDAKPKAHDIIGKGTRRTYWLTKFMPWSLRDKLFAKGVQKMAEKHRASGSA